MARQNIEYTDTLRQGADKINANDTEEYTDIAAATAAAAAASSSASSAASAASAAQSNIDSHELLTSNPHSVTASQVGLGLVDNTSDLSKPISTATQAALDTVTKVLVEGAVTLDSTAFGKTHLFSGTSADYTITLPTAVGNEGKMILLKGDPLAANLNKTVTIDGAGTETIDHRLTQVLSTGGWCSIIARVATGVGSWDIISFDQGAYIAWTPTFTGISAVTVDYRFKLQGRTLFLQLRHVTTSTGSGTTVTFTLPLSLTPAMNVRQMCHILHNGSTQAVGYIEFVTNANAPAVFTTLTAGTWTGTGDREIFGTHSLTVN